MQGQESLTSSHVSKYHLTLHQFFSLTFRFSPQKQHCYRISRPNLQLPYYNSSQDSGTSTTSSIFLPTRADNCAREPSLPQSPSAVPTRDPLLPAVQLFIHTLFPCLQRAAVLTYILILIHSSVIIVRSLTTPHHCHTFPKFFTIWVQICHTILQNHQTSCTTPARQTTAPYFFSMHSMHEKE